MNHKTPVGPLIGSGIVVLMLIFGAVSLVSKVFQERANPTILPPITEYERIDLTGTSTAKTASTSSRTQ